MEGAPLFIENSPEDEDDDKKQEQTKAEKKPAFRLFAIKGEKPKIDQESDEAETKPEPEPEITRPELKLVETEPELELNADLEPEAEQKPTAETKPEPDPETETDPEADSETKIELESGTGSDSDSEAETEAETDDSVETINEPSDAYVERELVLAVEEIEQAETPASHDAESEPDLFAADEAVGHFRDKIVEEREESSEAFESTLSVIEVSPEQVVNLREAEPADNELKLHEAAVDHEAEEPNQESNDEDESPKTFAAAVVGVTGGLLARRRGNMEAEDKQSIRDKLEEKVKELSEQLQEKEKTLRQVAAEKVKTDESVIERLRQAREKTEGEPEKPKHLGSFLVSSESKPSKTSEEALPKPAAEKVLDHSDKAVDDKRVENLNLNQLLEISKNIMIDGESLRDIYDTHLVAEKGLRRLVAEHLDGGDLRKTLRQEIVEREIDFERDPALRHLVLPESKVGGGSEALNVMLEKAGASLDDQAEEIAFFKARAKHDAQEQTRERQQNQMINVTMAVIIATLTILVIIIYLTKG